MSEFNIEDCDEVIANPGSSLAQMLALQLKNELKRIKELEERNAILTSQLAATEEQLKQIYQIIYDTKQELNIK